MMNPDLTSASPVTQKFIQIINVAGLPVTLTTVVVIFLILALGKSLLTVLTRYAIIRADYGIVGPLMIDTFKDFFNARWFFFSSSDQGNIMNILTRQVEYAGRAARSLGTLFSAAIQLLLLLGLIIYISWQVTIVCVAAAALFAAPFALADKLARRLGKRNVSTSNTMVALIHESLGAAKLILGSGNSAKTVVGVKNAFEAYSCAAVRQQTLLAAVPTLYQPLGFMVVVIGLLFSTRLSIPLAEVAILLFALFRATGPITQIVSEENSLNSLLPSYEEVGRMARSARELRQPSGTRHFQSFRKAIAVEGLYFSYPGRGEILSNVNVRIPKGKMVAFVGASGSGKSTLLDMMIGFNEPTKGQITIDGVPLKDFDIHSYRRRIGYVPQDSVLFNRTIRDNLLWANENASEEQIALACNQARAKDFIENLPQRYATEVGTRGVRLSGGEVQRVALARAILRNPDLLILDEATSSLDSNSEYLIRKAIESIAKGTTVIIVAHRLSTITDADYIYVMSQGRIMEEGSYQDLVQARGRFSEMVELQNLQTAN